MNWTGAPSYEWIVSLVHIGVQVSKFIGQTSLHSKFPFDNRTLEFREIDDGCLITLRLPFHWIPLRS